LLNDDHHTWKIWQLYMKKTLIKKTIVHEIYLCGKTDLIWWSVPNYLKTRLWPRVLNTLKRAIHNYPLLNFDDMKRLCHDSLPILADKIFSNHWTNSNLQLSIVGFWRHEKTLPYFETLKIRTIQRISDSNHWNTANQYSILNLALTYSC